MVRQSLKERGLPTTNQRTPPKIIELLSLQLLQYCFGEFSRKQNRERKKKCICLIHPRFSMDRAMDQPCPVCLQPSCVHDAESVLLPCCGHFGHLPCILQCMKESRYTYRSCLLCQEIIDQEQMLLHLQKWVDLQMPWAQQIMGSLCVAGINVPRTAIRSRVQKALAPDQATTELISKGELLLLASAKQNNPVAQACLGFHFYHKSSYLQAYNWYKRSAFDHEYHIALYNLAFLMEHGIGCEKNEQLAIGLYKRSLQQGNFLAQRALDSLENEEPNGTDTSEESAESDLLFAEGPQICALQ